MNANFEKYAREQLSGHEVAIDTDVLWANVQPHVKKDTGNRKIFFFFLLGLAVSMAGFGVYTMTTSSNTSLVASENKGPSTNDVKAIAGTITQPLAKQKEAKVIEMAESNTSETTRNSETTTQTKKETTVKEIPSVRKSVPKTQPTVLTQATNTKAVVDNSNAASDRKDNQDIIALSGGNEMAERNIPENVMLAPPAVLSNRYAQSIARISGLYPKALNFTAQKDFLIPADLMTAYDQRLEAYKASLKGQKKSSRSSLFRDMKFGVGLYTGIGRSTPNLDPKDDSADAFLLARTNSEKQLETLNFGINALIETEQGLYMRTGVEYTRIASLFSRSAQQVTIDSMEGVVEIIINSITGDTTEILGNVPVTRTTNYTKKSYNYYHLVDIPVIFGYNFGNYPWSIGVEGGIYANIYLKKKGDIGLEDETFYDIGEDPNSWYKDNIGISPFIGVNAAYNVSENIQVHMSPGFRFNSIFTTNDSPIKEQHANLGVQAGIRYFFD